MSPARQASAPSGPLIAAYDRRAFYELPVASQAAIWLDLRLFVEARERDERSQVVADG